MTETVLGAINRALHEALDDDDRVHVLGEDVLDPYGGAFKVTKGLSTRFPDRVHTTPVSEAAVVGVATGMALRGWRPVVEIMFGDFVTLVVDQLVNGAAKFATMYGHDVAVPLVVRTPMGGRRGYGPTHSQSLEKLFCGVPGLSVLAVHAFADPGRMLRTAVEDPRPVVFVENKALYPIALHDATHDRDLVVEAEGGGTPGGHDGTASLTVRVVGAPAPTLTLVAHGHMAELAREALLVLAYEHEVFAELVVVAQLAPCDASTVAASVVRTGRLLVAEEATPAAGWGAEVVARVAEAHGGRLRAVTRVGALDAPIPAGPELERGVLPGVDAIVAAATALG